MEETLEGIHKPREGRIWSTGKKERIIVTVGWTAMLWNAALYIISIHLLLYFIGWISLKKLKPQELQSQEKVNSTANVNPFVNQSSIKFFFFTYF